MVDLNAHEAGNGGQSQGKPTTRGVLLYSEREGPPLTVVLAREFRSVEGLHPPEIFNSNEKRILPSVVIRKPMHFGDWPVYCRLRPVIGANRFSCSVSTASGTANYQRVT